MLARLRDDADNVTGMKVSDRPWEAFERYLLDGFDIFVGPEALIHLGREPGPWVPSRRSRRRSRRRSPPSCASRPPRGPPGSAP